MTAVQPNCSGNGRHADFLAFAYAADAERRAVAYAGLRHVEVALLEHLERQQAAGKENGVQRKERNRRRHGAQARDGQSTRSRASPQRGISSCGTPIWSSTRATTKSTRSCGLCGW